MSDGFRKVRDIPGPVMDDLDFRRALMKMSPWEQHAVKSRGFEDDFKNIDDFRFALNKTMDNAGIRHQDFVRPQMFDSGRFSVNQDGVHRGMSGYDKLKANAAQKEDDWKRQLIEQMIDMQDLPTIDQSIMNRQRRRP